VIYLDLGDLIAIASRVLVLEVDAILHVTDLGLAESALARPQASFAGHDFHPELPGKVAALLHSLAKNHAFLDGNKRIAVVATQQFLKLNGYELDLSPDEEVFEFIVGVAAGDIAFEKVGEWVTSRLQRRNTDG
jgi:death-on-curing protein